MMARQVLFRFLYSFSAISSLALKADRSSAVIKVTPEASAVKRSVETLTASDNSDR